MKFYFKTQVVFISFLIVLGLANPTVFAVSSLNFCADAPSEKSQIGNVLVSTKSGLDPIKNIEMQIFNGNILVSAITDNNGSAYFSSLPIGEYTILLTSIPYGLSAKTTQASCSILANKTSVICFDISPAPTGDISILALDNITKNLLGGGIINIYRDASLTNLHTQIHTRFNTPIYVNNVPVGKMWATIEKTPNGYVENANIIPFFVYPAKQMDIIFVCTRLIPDKNPIILFACLATVAIIFVLVWCYCKKRK